MKLKQIVVLTVGVILLACELSAVVERIGYKIINANKQILSHSHFIEWDAADDDTIGDVIQEFQSFFAQKGKGNYQIVQITVQDPVSQKPIKLNKSDYPNLITNYISPETIYNKGTEDEYQAEREVNFNAIVLLT